MPEPEDLKAIRDILESVSQSIAGAGIARAAPLTPGAIVAIAKAIGFLIDHVDALEKRVKALESASKR